MKVEKTKKIIEKFEQYFFKEKLTLSWVNLWKAMKSWIGVDYFESKYYHLCCITYLQKYIWPLNMKTGNKRSSSGKFWMAKSASDWIELGELYFYTIIVWK